MHRTALSGPVSNGRMARVTVSDSGIGIPKADRSTCSTASVDKARARPPGEGLGLHRQTVIPMHEGTVDVDSEE